MRLLLALLLLLGFAAPAAAESLVRIEGKNLDHVKRSHIKAK